MMLDCTLEVRLLGVLGGMVVRGMVGSKVVRYIIRGMSVYFSQDHMCRVLKNVRERNIRSVREGLRSYVTAMELCSESNKGV